ncbi:MAG: TonB-dependent receptor [Myxococcota bacterium]
MRHRIFTLIAAAALLAGSQAHAQTPESTAPDSETPPTQNETESEASKDEDTEEITVTTERRSQKLQDVAAVVKAVRGDELRSLGIDDFTDLSIALPQLNIGNREGNVEIFIRGIGDDNNTELSEPRSAVLLDGVYISRPRGLGAFFFDLDRVELNIGPQGTLRGRNATGGSLNIISKRPDFADFGGYIEAGYGNFNNRELQGAINIPVLDNLAFRVAGYYQGNDSKIENVGILTDLDESRKTDDLAFRASALWEPVDRLSFLVVGDFLNSEGTGYGGLDYFPYFQSQLGPNDTSLNIQNTVQDLENPWSAVTLGSQPTQNQRIFGVRGEARFETDYLTLEYLGSFRSVDFVFDRSATDAFFPGFNDFFSNDTRTVDINDPMNPDTVAFFDNFSRTRFDQLFDSQVHELRVFSNSDQRFRWTAGAFFFRETGISFFNTTADKGNVFAGVEFAFPDVARESLAFYGDATFDIFSWLRVTGGARYTNESLSRSGFGATYLYLFPTDTSGDPPDTFNFSCCNNQRFGTEGIDFAGRDRTVFHGDVDIGTPDGRAALFRAGIRQFGQKDDIDDQIELLLTEGRTQSGFGLDGREISSVTPNDASRNDNFINWRARIEANPYKNGLIYLGLSTGTNSGGFNDAVQTPSGILSPEFDIETVLVAEVGSKNKFDIGGYQSLFNVAAFWYTYEDQQFTVLAPAVQGMNTGMGGNGGLVSLRQNVGDSRILGFDVDYTQNLPLFLRFRANLQYLNTEFTNSSVALVDTRFNFPNGPDDTIPFDPVGNQLPKASEWSGAVTLAQLIPTGIGNFEWSASMGFRSEYYLTIFNGNGSLPEVNAANFPFENVTPADGQSLAEAQEAARENLRNTIRNSAGSASDIVNGYIRFDLGVAYTPVPFLRIEAYAKNLTNVGYAQTALVSPNLNLRFLNDPRMIGGRIRLTY